MQPVTVDAEQMINMFPIVAWPVIMLSIANKHKVLLRLRGMFIDLQVAYFIIKLIY